MSAVVAPADNSIVVLDRFIQATRDSGYRGTGSAVAEIVDNALQAGATRIDITIDAPEGAEYPVRLSVRDNGSGMDPDTLRLALRFGGSTRFNDRAGMGRYGMGLPNASLSQSRRVTVYAWTAPRLVHMSYLDVDEIAGGTLRVVPEPQLATCPAPGATTESGTLIVWDRCDRLENRRISTLVQKLSNSLGRRFRRFLWEGRNIVINGERVEAIDPLFLSTESKFHGADPFGEPLEYEVRIGKRDGKEVTGRVRVIFSELPVHDWQQLSNEEKRRRGISKGAGVSIVRAGREVDYGWFFLGGKRRENYDDWWRCEIAFEPILDEAFGITHTKQQVRPQAYLTEILAPDMEAAARALNTRARRAHLAAKTAGRMAEVETVAREREARLRPLPGKASPRDQKLLRQLRRQVPSLRKGASAAPGPRIVECALSDTSFLVVANDGGSPVVAVNQHHPFYKKLYKPLADSDAPRDRELRKCIDLLLLAAGRAQLAALRSRKQQQSFNAAWSDVLATYLDD